MATAEWRYVTTEVYQRDENTPNPIIAELPFTGVSYTNQLNSNGTFQGHILLSGLSASDMNAYEGTTPGKTILWVIYSDPDTGVAIPVWSGVIWAREYDSESQTLAVTAQEMMSLYNRRRIASTLSFEDVFYDPAQIAYDIMAYTEARVDNGFTGLEFNTCETFYRTKQKWDAYELKSVYSAIKDLSTHFFDFVIKPYSGNTYLYNKFIIGSSYNPENNPAIVPLGTPYDETDPFALTLQFPGNVIAYQYPEDAADATNKLYGLGYGANEEKILAIATDPSKILTGYWPLLEDTVNFIDIPDVQLLKDLTKGQLEATSYPPTTVHVVLAPYVDPLYPTYQVGDQVRLSINDTFFPAGEDPYYEIMRIAAITVSPGEDGPSRVTLTLTRRLADGEVN